MFNGVQASGCGLPPQKMPPLVEHTGLSVMPSTAMIHFGATASTAAEPRSAAVFQSVAALPVPQVAAPCGSFFRSTPITLGTFL